MPEGAPSGANEIYGLLQETVTGLWVDLIGHIPFFIGGLLALVFFAILNKAAVFSVSRAMTGWKARRSLKDLLLRLMSIGIWVVGLLVTAMIIFPGLTPANALGALGVASIAVGLAFKDIFENFFAGILLLWKFPFENGDFIECQDIKGQVEDVTIRMTRIRLMSGEELLVPNAFLYKNPVRVVTSRPYRRVSVMSGVAYGE
jgi:small-conductance mechanosensitive channel